MRTLSHILVLLAAITVGVVLYKREVMLRASPVRLIPRDILFGNPVKASPRIAHNGAQLAYLAPVDNVLNIWVKTLGKDDDHVITHDTHRGIRSVAWSPDDTSVLYLQDKNGDENWRIYSASLDGQVIQDLTPFDNVQARIVDIDSDKPHDILIELNKDNPALHDIYKLTLSSGQLTLLEKNPGNVASWIPDDQWNIRGKLLSLDDGSGELWVRDTPTAGWRLLAQFNPDDAQLVEIIGFSKDGKTIAMLDPRDTNTNKLVAVDVVMGNITVMYHDHHYDITAVIQQPKTKRIQAVTVTKARQEIVVLDSTIQHDIETIKDATRGDIALIDRDDADKFWVVGVKLDIEPAAYYLYLRDNHKVEFLFDSKPALRNYKLAPMEPFTITSRDGLKLEGYVTYPIGVEHRNLPVVVNVHGGPYARDTWGYSSEAQWFANRGYISAQINYRGSTGYGKDFVNASTKEWGAKMHDDILDTVNYFVSNGIADPKRIALYGGSYGGYEALVGAAFTPDVFSCAVDIVGPSNLLTLLTSLPPYWIHARRNFYNKVGDPTSEQAFLKSRSPLFSAHNIKIPVLIAQGANDPRVKRAESEQIVEALKEHKIPYEYLLFPDEGHGFARPENKLKFYEAAEKFLARCLGGRYQE